MKLRIRGNSLRLRLTRTEIAELAAAGFIENQVQFGEQPECVFVYRLELSDVSAKPVTVFSGQQLCMHLPSKEAKDWVQSKKVEVYGEESWGLKLAIEKDFKCLDPRLDEDESDAFENPGGKAHIGCAATSE